jgi:predicted negative regulator of RcsB-dependent stress response
MAAPKIRPFTEDELYVVAKKESSGGEFQDCQPAPPEADAGKLVSLPLFLQEVEPAEVSYWNKNKTAIIIAGILILIGAGAYMYYTYQKRKEKEKESGS